MNTSKMFFLDTLTKGSELFGKVRIEKLYMQHALALN